MSSVNVKVELLPTTVEVAAAITEIFAMDESDLRDVTAIALQDPVILANIIILVNESFAEKKRPVVNTVEAAINLVGQPALEGKLLSIKSIQNMSLSSIQKHKFNLVRNRIVTAARLTRFWAEYMGEKNTEEQYCASMFTGFVDLYQAISSNEGLVSTQEESCLESMDKLKSLYSFDKKDIGCLPDSIQQVLTHSCCNKRLSLSVLVYELISELEQGYSTNEFHKKLQRIICHIDQSESRAANDLARQLVLLNRDFSFSSYNHAAFLLSTNTEEIGAIQVLH